MIWTISLPTGRTDHHTGARLCPKSRQLQFDIRQRDDLH